MVKPTPTQVWAAIFGLGMTGNFIAWRKGEKATACASFFRPIIEALGPVGGPAMWGGFWFLGRHIVKPIPRGRRRLSLRKEL